jgi:plastocyanin
MIAVVLRETRRPRRFVDGGRPIDRYDAGMFPKGFWLCLVLLAATAVSSSAQSPSDKATAGPGTVSGRALFEGTPEAPTPLKMAADPVCAREGKGATSEAILVGEGGALQNVFVYVKDGLGDRTYPPPATPVVLDQKGCRYVPHVFGVQVGQAVEIVNSDPTLHNVHAMPKLNTEFNVGQPVQGMRLRRTFAKPEVMVAVRCDVHGWMGAYAGVLPHPFFAVTEPDGSFEIKGLPPGTYTLEAWHERLGTRTQTVTIDDKKGATATFSFAPRS